MSSVPVYENFINGQFVASTAHLDVINPATGVVLSKVPASTAEDVDRALAAARAAQKDWSRKPAIERAGHLRRIAAKLRENVQHLARTITLEQGKVSGLAERLAAEQGITPDAVGGQLITQAGLQAQIVLRGQGVDQVADQLQLLRPFDFTVQLGQLQGAEAGVVQAAFNTQAVVDAQLSEQLHTGDAAPWQAVGGGRHAVIR